METKDREYYIMFPIDNGDKTKTVTVAVKDNDSAKKLAFKEILNEPYVAGILHSKEITQLIWQVTLIIRKEFILTSFRESSKNTNMLALDLIIKNNVTNINEFLIQCLPFILNLSRYAKHLERSNLKTALYQIKSNFLNYAIKKGIKFKKSSQIGFRNDDKLILLEYGNDFVSHTRLSDSVMNLNEWDNLPRIKEVLQKELYTKSDIDMTFFQYLDMLRQVNNKTFWRILELK